MVMGLKFSFVTTSALLLAAVLAGALRAEKVDLSAQELRQTATHVVVGKVKAIYERTESLAPWRQTFYLAELEVAQSEKGEGIKPGELVYVRYWHRRWIGNGPPEPNTSGHRGLPKVNETLRVYLARKAYDGFTRDNQDGGFNVIGANGFEPLKNTSK
jgi:hypothetical protein